MAATRSVTAEPFVEAMPQIPHTAGQCRGGLERGIACTPFRLTWCFWGGGKLDPHTQAFVYATAAITSIVFTISVLNVLAVVLSHVLS
jgi:hypothetical protein